MVAGLRVWTKASSDVGREGVIIQMNNNPCSWWVQVGGIKVRHLFVLDHHQNKKPRSSSDFWGLVITLATILLIHAFNSKLPVDSSTKLDHANCSTSHFHTSDSKNISSSNSERGDENGEHGSNQVLSRRSDKPSSEESGRGGGPNPILKNQFYRDEPASMRILEKPTEDLVSTLRICGECIYMIR